MIDTFLWTDVVDCYSIHSSELDSEEEVKNDFAQWQQLCLKLHTDNRPATPLETLDVIQIDYATSRSFSVIFAPLPVYMHCREIVQRLEDR
jgi:hypothetical protein